MVQMPWETVWHFLIKPNMGRDYHRTPKFHSWAFTQINDNLSSHKNLYVNIYNSFIYSNLKLETIQVFFKIVIVKQAGTSIP